MHDLEIIKGFLRKKSSYLRHGDKAVGRALMKKFNTSFDLSVIKRAKKEVRKEYNSRFNETPVAKVTDELIARFNLMAEELNMGSLIVPQLEKNTIKLPERRACLKSFLTPTTSEQEGMHILLGCNHVPFHNKQLHSGILSLIEDHQDKIKGFHLMGDFLDLNPLSSHDKGKFTAVPGLTLSDEYIIGNDLLDQFDIALPESCWKTYLYGNHEDRYNRWMKNMDNAKTPLTSPEDGLELQRRGYNVKTNWSQDYITLGRDFDIFHGVYFSIHNAKAHLDKLRRSCAYVHTHRIQNYREGNMAAYNIGACADFASAAFGYASRPMKQQWANGFAINMIDRFGVSHVVQISASRDGHFYFGGKYY